MHWYVNKGEYRTNYYNVQLGNCPIPHSFAVTLRLALCSVSARMLSVKAIFTLWHELSVVSFLIRTHNKSTLRKLCRYLYMYFFIVAIYMLYRDYKRRLFAIPGVMK